MAIVLSSSLWLVLTLLIFLHNEPIAAQNNDVLVAPDPCNRYEVNGCSVPLFRGSNVVKRFLPACNRHDVCYACGVSRNISRAECDTAFFDDMKNICKTGSVVRGKRSAPNEIDMFNTDVLENSVQTLLTNDRLFSEIAEDLLGKDLNYLALATDAEVEVLVDKITAVWTKLLRALHDERVSIRQALDLAREHTSSIGSRDVVKRNDDYNEDDDDGVYDFNTCIASASTGRFLVRTFGFFSYENPLKWFCHEDFVNDCLPR